MNIKLLLSDITAPDLPNFEDGLDNIISDKIYVDNVLSESPELVKRKDNKRLIHMDKLIKLIDYPKGYATNFPVETQFDFTNSPNFISASNKNFKAVISREWSVSDDVDSYIDYYFNRFILDETYLKANNIKLLENYKKDNIQVLTIKLNELDDTLFNTYTYIIFKTKTRHFFRVMYKYKENDTVTKEQIKDTIENFRHFRTFGAPTYDLDFKPIVPLNWTEETKTLYNNINNSDKIKWGIFTEDIQNVGMNEIVPKIEKSIEYKFDIILAYIHLNGSFPTEFMNKCYDEGKLVELTYQITLNNNETLNEKSPVLSIFRGEHEEEIRNFAKAAKAFGHPFLFRLNNEMNSDWTSYSGVINLSDPDLFIENWRTIYNIFQEEGVNNAIWIFNPNDRNYPPAEWNNFTAYYPGNEYVQMIGVTGYNTGTYYKNVTGETWREFKTIYDEIKFEYKGIFDKFPWIITEFSSSSIGGDKAKWITNMFKNLYKYPNIKMAVWFSYADLDYREGKEGQAARPYWLDENDATIKAFKEGIKGLMKKGSEESD